MHCKDPKYINRDPTIGEIFEFHEKLLKECLKICTELGSQHKTESEVREWLNGIPIYEYIGDVIYGVDINEVAHNIIFTPVMD